MKSKLNEYSSIFQPLFFFPTDIVDGDFGWKHWSIFFFKNFVFFFLLFISFMFSARGILETRDGVQQDTVRAVISSRGLQT